MGLSEQQLGRLAAFIAELGEHPGEDVLQDAVQELRKQAPALHHTVFSAGYARGQEKGEKKARAQPALPADREVAMRAELDTLKAQVEAERHARVEAEVARAAEQLGLNGTWVANELAAGWRTGTLSFDSAGQVEVQGVVPAAGESGLAAYTRMLKGRCPPELVRSSADRGAGTGGDRGAGGSGQTQAQQYAAGFQKHRDAVPNPLAPPAPTANTLGASPRYHSPADALLPLIQGRVLEREMAALQGEAAQSSPKKE